MNILEATLANLLKQLVFRLGPKWIITLQHNIQQDTHRPHIRVHGHMVPFGYDLGCHIGRGTTKCVDG